MARSPYMMKRMIDKIFYEQNLALVWVTCGALLTIFVLRGISGYVQAVELARSAIIWSRAIRKRIFDHLMKPRPRLL